MVKPAFTAACSACPAVPPTTPRQPRGRPGLAGPSSGVAVASSTAHVAPNATAAASTATAIARILCRRATGRPEPRVAGEIPPRGATIRSIWCSRSLTPSSHPDRAGSGVRAGQLRAGPLELLSHGVVRAAGDLGDLVGSEAVQVEEHDHRALLRGECPRHEVANRVGAGLVGRHDDVPLDEPLVRCDRPPPAA